MASEKQSLAGRVLALRPIPWDVRTTFLAFLATGAGAIGFCRVGSWAIAASRPAMAGRAGAIHFELVALVLAAACAYHTVVGAGALLGHYGKSGDPDERQAWTSAAIGALFLPMIGAISIWGLSVGLRPFPSYGGKISAPVERFWEERNRNDDGVVFHLNFQGNNRTFSYDCLYGRHGPWCSAHSALMAAVTAPAPHQAQLVPVGDGMAALALDGRTVLTLDRERWEQRSLPLLGGGAAGFLFMFYFVWTIRWVGRAMAVHARVVARRAAGQSSIFE